MNEQIDVAVVGGGLSGLATAALLTRRGRKVTVFEGSNKLGGEAQSPAMGGLPVNLGPHALYLGGQSAKVLRELGIPWTGHVPPVRGAKAWHGGRLVPLPSTPWALLATPLLDWSERFGLARILLPLLRSPNTGAEPDESLEAWLERACPAPAVRQLMHALFRVTTYSNAPAMISASFACAQLHSGLARNVHYLPFCALVESLRATCGATIETSRPVRKVHPDGRLAFDDRELRANTIVIALPLNAALKVYADARLEQFRAQSVPARAACLDLVLSELPIPTQKVTFGLDAPLYASVHREEPHGVILQAARYLAPGEEGRHARKGIEAMIDAFQPGWRTKLLAERFLPELTATSAIPLASRSAKGFGVRLSEHVYAAADWASGGVLSDGGLQAAHEIAATEGASVRLSA